MPQEPPILHQNTSLTLFDMGFFEPSVMGGGGGGGGMRAAIS